MSEQKKPDFAELTRQVLYNLAALGGEVHENKLLLCEILSILTNRPREEFVDRYKDQRQARTDQLYEVSMDAAKIPPPEDP